MVYFIDPEVIILKRIGIILLLLSLLLSVFSDSQAENKDQVDLVCLNIGKADCMLLLYKDQAYLIDTGYEQNAPAIFTMLSHIGISRLNGVFLTHCHEDHEGGLMALAKSDIEVESWFAAEIYHDVKESKHPMLLAAKERGQIVTWLSAGDQIFLDDNTAFTVLGPLNTDTENENNNSMVLQFSSPHGSMLFAGDMKEEEENQLLKKNLFSPVDVLKCGHHGDNKATGLGFLRAIQPKAAIILTNSREEQDTPAASTLTRLAAVGCKTYVSQDFQDAIWLTLQNKKISVYDITWNQIPKRETSVSLSLDLSDDRLLIKNTGKTEISLQDWHVFSSKGNDLMSLPAFSLQPGETYIIGSRASKKEYNLKWDKKQIWHQNKLDHAILYDAWGRPVACTDNGKPE